MFATGNDMLKVIVGILLGLLIDLTCRWFDIPVPSPPKLTGALLVGAMTISYMVSDKFIGLPTRCVSMKEQSQISIRLFCRTKSRIRFDSSLKVSLWQFSHYWQVHSDSQRAYNEPFQFHRV